jgi:transcriptional regulator GlxA family with amidase domain
MSLSLNLDDYIIKPFNDKLFLARIKYLIDLSQNHFEDIINHKKNKTIISQKDKEWLAKIEALVRESLSDVNLTPTLLAEKINLSQVHMDRKLKTLIGFTTSKYILEARLRIALEIIEKKEVTLVKEVCFMVGFKSPRSFSRNFKQRFGMFPSELINK